MSKGGLTVHIKTCESNPANQELAGDEEVAGADTEAVDDQASGADTPMPAVDEEMPDDLAKGNRAGTATEQIYFGKDRPWITTERRENVIDRLRALKTVWILKGGAVGEEWFEQNASRSVITENLYAGHAKASRELTAV